METSKMFKHYGEKIKQLSFHPEKPLLLAAQYNGKIIIFNYETQTVAKVIEVSSDPLRTAIWISEDRIITSGDDKKVRIFSFHTTQKLVEFEGHKDFIRKVVFNNKTGDILTCSDDKTIKKFKQGKDGSSYEEVMQWTEHKHFVMDLKLHPRENGFFASASLDSTIKLWNVNSKTSNGTLTGHKNGVNCIDFFRGERSLLLSGSDDYSVVVWDLSSRSIISKLVHHEANVIDVVFLDRLPLFASVSEDGKLNFYNLKNFEFCFDIANFMNKGWSLSTKDNLVAAAYDEGCVVMQIGSNRPLSSTHSGKLLWSSNSEVFSANLKAVVTKNLKDFEAVDFPAKELGNLDIFPTALAHSPGGQLVSFHDGAEYAIYKALNFKLVLFGQAQSFVWGTENRFAILDKMNELEIYNAEGKVLKALKFDFYVTQIFGGEFLGVSGGDYVLFYDWNGEKCVGKIDVELTDVFWNNDKLILKNDKQFFFLKYQEVEEDAEEEVFQLVCQVDESIYSGFWANGVFFYVDQNSKFKVLVQDKTFLVCNLKDNKMISDYLVNHQRFFFFDNEGKVTTYSFSKKLLNILKKCENLESLLENVQKETKLLTNQECDFFSKILVAFDRKKEAYAVVRNTRSKFELAIELGLLNEAIAFCEELKEPIYWKKLGDLALITGEFPIAEKAFWSCEDLNSLLLLASCLGDRAVLLKVADKAKESKHWSVAFLGFWICGRIQECLDVLMDSKKFGQAAIFCKNFCPSRIEEVFKNWKSFLESTSDPFVKRIANPFDFEEDFGELRFLQKVEQIVAQLYNTKFRPQDFCEVTSKLHQMDFYKIAKEEGFDVLEKRLLELQDFDPLEICDDEVEPIVEDQIQDDADI
jgi:coatomer subunit beta'